MTPPSMWTASSSSDTHYTHPGDPRRRATALLLDQLARDRNIATHERDLDSSPEAEDVYGIGSSNSVVLELAGRWELVERPSEGSLYEALSRLTRPRENNQIFKIFIEVFFG